MAINTFSGGNPINSLQAAGKNKIINGDFGIWQRGTTFTPSATGYFYGADRWLSYVYSASTCTLSQQTFTPGTAPVAGYEGQYFMRVSSTNTATFIGYRVEDVRTLAGQTVTLSFWAKSNAGQTLTSVGFEQGFGSGGSSPVTTNFATPPTITTSWARYTLSTTMPSVSGKTIGVNSYIQINIQGAVSNALDIWGVQLEQGNSATTFTTATGTIQGELAACQRYFERTSVGSNALIWSTPRAGYFTYYWKVSKRNTSGTSTLQQTGMYISAGTLSISGGNSTDSIGFFTSTAADIAFNTGYVQIDNEL